MHFNLEIIALLTMIIALLLPWHSNSRSDYMAGSLLLTLLTISTLFASYIPTLFIPGLTDQSHITAIACTSRGYALLFLISLMLPSVARLRLTMPIPLHRNSGDHRISLKDGAILPKDLMGYFAPSGKLYSQVNILSIFTWLTFFNSTYLLYNYIMYGLTTGNYGIMLVSTMDAALIGIMYPLTVQHALKTRYLTVKLCLLLLPILAVLSTTGSTGLGGLCLGILIMLICSLRSRYEGLSKQWKWISGLTAVAIPLGLFITAYLINPNLLSDSGRVACWRWSMKWWMENANHLTGTGFGTYSVVGPMIQIMTNNSIGNYFTFMHNDWLQLLFEVGYPIFLLSLYCYYRLLIASYKRCHYLFSSILVYGAVMVIGMPMHYPVTAIIGVLLIKEAYKRTP